VPRRVFEIAKELGVKSKVVLEKCQSEGIPNMNNHMSSVSAGLEATIREWFGGGEADTSGGTAVQTTPKVDVEKARAAAKAKARPKAKPRAKAKPKPAEELEKEEPKKEEAVEAKAPEKAEPEKPVAAPPPAPEVEAPAEPEAPVETEAPEAMPVGPAAEAPSQAAAEAGGGPQMNVPVRPKVISPAGPRLEVQKPAQLSGPRVVRVERPDPVRAPRPRRPEAGSIPSARGPRSGAGAGVRDMPVEEEGRSARRNKRRSGPGGPGGPGGGGGRRGGGGGGGGGGGAGRGRGDRSSEPAFREQDLLEREARLSRAGGFLRQRRRDMKKKQESPGERATTAASAGGAVRISEPFTIKDLSAATGVKASDIIKRLFMESVMATVNSGIDAEKAQEIMLEHNIELEVEAAKSAEQVVKEQFAERETVDVRPRSPVVTILGHVDHGKTSLLDKIRKTKVAEGEAGGITQATSAFRVPVHVGEEEKQVVFLDTPGHEAFTAMRARGAQVTDIVVLVVAADDGVMPQTIESITHSRAAGVPIVVALNKIDKPEATDSNIQKILGQLAEHELNPVEWGGSTEVVRTSAEIGDGVDDLLETLDFQAQLLELKADFGGPARGSVIEARVDEGRGVVANVLVQDGQLKVGDFIVCGRAYGRVRDITNDRGERIAQAGPADPVQVSGLDELPDAGDKFYIVDSLRKAQEAAEQRRHRERERGLAKPKVTLENMFSQMEAAQTKELLVVIKADVQGSVDVLVKAAEDISTDDIRVRVLHAAVGGITESDIILADASRAVIIGFNVIPSAKARQMAEQKNVQIRSYSVIYDIVDDLKRAAEGMLEPEIREEVLGHAEVRAVFKISKVGAVAGCYVTDGVIERNAFVRVTRGDIVVENDRVLEQLKRFKDDAKEVRNGQECGMKIVGYDDIKEGDILECYRKREVRRKL